MVLLAILFNGEFFGYVVCAKCIQCKCQYDCCYNCFHMFNNTYWWKWSEWRISQSQRWLINRPSSNWQYTPNKLAGDKGIEPLHKASKAPALPLCKSPVLNWRRRRVLPPQWLLDHGSLANCCRNLTIYVTSVKSFDKLRFLQETILSVFGSIVKWSCIKLEEREGFEPPEAFTPTVFKTVALDHSATSPFWKNYM